jgi:hypothetical protein
MNHARKMNNWAIKKRKLVINNQRGNDFDKGCFDNTNASHVAATTTFRIMDKYPRIIIVE